MNHEPAPNKSRGPVVNLLLAAIPGGLFLFFLNFLTLGVFFWVVASVFGLVLLGFLHYVLWGYAFSEEVAHDQREQEIEDRAHRDREN